MKTVAMQFKIFNAWEDHASHTIILFNLPPTTCEFKTKP